MKLLLLKTNFLLLILLVLFACSVDDTTSITPATTELAIDYEISGNFYMALTNNAIELEQKRDFVSQSNFFVSPSLPNGLSLDVTNGNISGTPTKTSLPTSYTITANVDGKSYNKVLFLGVSPSQVWVTNVNSTQPYNLTAYVVGDGDKQAGVSWSSSDKTIAMVNGGMVSLLLTATPGTAVISASKNSYSNGVAFTISKVTDLDGGKIIKERENSI